MKTQIIIFVVLSILFANIAYTAGIIDSADINENTDWRAFVLTLGIFASIQIQCSEIKDLIFFGGVTENVEMLCKWLFRISIFFLLLSLFIWIDSDLGWKILMLWCVLRVCQALYLSGAEFGVKNSEKIRKKLNEPRN
jgi:hypothetical protein